MSAALFFLFCCVCGQEAELERTLLSARNRGVKSLQMHCLADNQRMQQLALKFEADLKFDFGSVIGEVDPPRYTPLSLMREAVVDAHGVANATLDVQSVFIRARTGIRAGGGWSAPGC